MTSRIECYLLDKFVVVVVVYFTVVGNFSILQIT